MRKRRIIHIGTSGWHYEHWQGPFYPEDLKKRDFLDYYIKYFDTVEINNSFYQMPSAKTLKDWKDTVLRNFIFSIKASRYITHMKKLKDSRQPVERFIDAARHLGEKLGPILFQLPPHWRCNTERLKSFLNSLPTGYRYTMEFRDETWFNDEVYKLLRDNNVAFCIYHLEGRLSPKEITANFVYVRLHGPGGAYEGSYDKKTLTGWAGRLSAWAKKGLQAYCYFDNDQAGYAAKDAARLKEMVS